MIEIDSYNSIFLALPLDSQSKEKFAAVSQGIQQLNSPMTFQKAETVHMTLRFFDRISSRALSRHLEAFRNLALAVTPFRVAIDGYDYFGRPGQRKVLWLKTDCPPELTRLAERTQAEWPEERPFVPHVTLGRIKDPRDFSRYEKGVDKILKDFYTTSTIDRLRLYGAQGNQKQIPLMDFEFR